MIRTWTAERQRAAVMWISLPFGEKRIAFSMRFERTCPIWIGIRIDRWQLGADRRPDDDALERAAHAL